MATLLQRGFRLLNRCMEPAAAESVRYLRGAEVISDAMRALLTINRVDLTTQDGASIIGRRFVWQLKRDELMVNGAEVRPERLDQIEWDYNGRTYAFQVLPEQAMPEDRAVDMRADYIPANTQLLEVR